MMTSLWHDDLLQFLTNCLWRRLVLIEAPYKNNSIAFLVFWVYKKVIVDRDWDWDSSKTKIEFVSIFIKVALKIVLYVNHRSVYKYYKKSVS